VKTTSDALLDQVHLLESADQLDGWAARLQTVSDSLSPVAKDALSGSWIGHPLHPAMTDLPIGFWTSAWVLDIVGGERSRPAAQLLTGLGVLSAVPTLATGLNAFRGVEDQESKRVGVVHAVGNVGATGAYLASWRLRRSGHWARAVGWGMIGATLATAAAYLGGHLGFGELDQGESGDGQDSDGATSVPD
jgi:uncharacterized membrane protein